MRTIFFSILFAAGFAHASIGGSLIVKANDSKANLVIYETMQSGTLAKFYDQMRVPESGSGVAGKKQFKLSNDRLQILCTRGLSSTGLDATNCTFIVVAGPTESDISTHVSSAQKVGSMTLAARYSSELHGIFPAGSDGVIDFKIQTTSATLEVTGTTTGNLNLYLTGR